MMRVLATIILIFFITNSLSSQEGYYKLNNGYTRMPDQRMVSCLSFSVKGDTKSFINTLVEDFGEYEYEDFFYNWYRVKVKEWSKGKCTLRVQVFYVKGNEEVFWRISISAENKRGDLLDVNSKSYPIIKQYFKEIIDKIYEGS